MQSTPASESSTCRRHGAQRSRSGVALVIVLGILLLISLVVLSFVRVAGDSRDTARLASERLRAEHLARTALVRGMEDLNARMAGRLFYWDVAPEDTSVTENFIVSTNGPAGVRCALLTPPGALVEMPGILTNEAVQIATNCHWTPIVAGTTVVGRCAYLIANLSGFLDANAVGGMPQSNRASPAELDLSLVMDDPALFAALREEHIRYETRNELLRINSSMTNADDVFTVFSYDPNPDVYFTTTNGIGTRFFLTNLTNRVCITDIQRPEWRSNLVAVLSNHVTNAEFIANCIMDYQDQDRGNSVTNVPIEAVPLINEIGFQVIATNKARFLFELWYPFHPAMRPNEEFVFVMHSPELGVQSRTLTNMSFGGPNEFNVVDTGEYTANAMGVVTMNYALAWCASVTQEIHSGLITVQTNGAVYCEFDDPRLAFQTTDLDASPNARFSTNGSMYMMNGNCSAWSPGNQGLPIRIPDRLMQNIGELGLIWSGEPWKTLDLTQTNIAAMLDRLTVRGSPGPARGLVNAGTTNALVWETFFSAIPIGVTNAPLPSTYGGTTSVATASAFADYLSSRTDFAVDLSGFIGALAESDCYTNFLAGVPNAGADHREDLLRGIVEMVSFRHQLYLVVLAAQSLGADGRTPTAERRALALVWRDGYTGQYFVRNFRWLTD
jgi:hypothetical protein